MEMALDIRIPEPCTRRWEDLEPAGDGTRLCTRCQQRVTDFRGMSDDEVTLAHALAGGRICGVYDETQLRGDAQRRVPAPPRLVTLALGATLLSGTAAAQTSPSPRAAAVQTPLAPSRTPSPDAAEAEVPPPVPADTFVIRGTVRDEQGQPLPGASILVVGETNLRARTDSLGAYVLRLGDRRSGQRVTLQFIQLGRRSVLAEVSADDRAPRVDATLPAAVVEIEGIVVRATPQRQSIFQRLRSLFR
jgi:hypothetical protein